MTRGALGSLRCVFSRDERDGRFVFPCTHKQPSESDNLRWTLYAQSVNLNFSNLFVLALGDVDALEQEIGFQEMGHLAKLAQPARVSTLERRATTFASEKLRKVIPPGQRFTMGQEADRKKGILSAITVSKLDVAIKRCGIRKDEAWQ